VLVGPDPRLNELGRLVGALIAEPSPLPVRPPTRAALMLTLRLGLRALETCSLEWRAVDLDGAAPSITVTRSKTGAGLRALPLPRAAVEILRELRANSREDQPFLFPAEAGSKRARHLHPDRCLAPSRGPVITWGLPTLRRTICGGLSCRD
jgi:integrase